MRLLTRLPLHRNAVTIAGSIGYATDHFNRLAQKKQPTMNNDNFYHNRTAVITGGGRGFGKAFGVALASAGAHVVLVDIDGNVAETAAAEIRSQGFAAT